MKVSAMSSTQSSDEPPGLTHLRVGYLHETWAELTLTVDGQLHANGPRAAAALALYASVAQQSAYHGLTPPQVLAQMAQRFRGLLWAASLDDNDQQ